MSEQSVKSELAQSCYQEGRVTFPLVVWDEASFVAACLERWRGQPGKSLTGRLSPDSGRARGEEYLVTACLAARRGAVETLEREYVVKLAARVRKACGCPELVDDALQSLREKLLLPPNPKLAAYENRGHLSAWLTIVAIRTALDARRAQQGTLRLTALDEDLVAHALDPESQCSTRQFDSAIRQALREAFRRLPEQQRFALKMQVVAGWSIDQIGRSLSMHRATAARWLIVARERLEQDVRDSLVQGLGLSAVEVQGALGRMRSRLDLRISQFFQSTRASAAPSEIGGAS